MKTEKDRVRGEKREKDRGKEQITKESRRTVFLLALKETCSCSKNTTRILDMHLRMFWRQTVEMIYNTDCGFVINLSYQKPKYCLFLPTLCPTAHIQNCDLHLC